MTKKSFLDLDRFMSGLKKRNPYEIEFQQAVHEVMQSVPPVIRDNKKYQDGGILSASPSPIASSLSASLGWMTKERTSQGSSKSPTP